MVFTIGLGDAIWSGRIPGASFFIMMIVIIKSSPETIKQICFLLNYEVNNSKCCPCFYTLFFKVSNAFFIIAAISFLRSIKKVS